MWRKRLLKLCPGAELGPACAPVVLKKAEKALGVAFPEELRKLLADADGVVTEDGLDLIWPAARIREDNLAFRSNRDFEKLYMSFESLLFFADASNGDQFAFAICGGVISRSDVFVWDHETDSRNWVAPSLERYVEWLVSGKIEV
jgi:SUKH superfamily protein